MLVDGSVPVQNTRCGGGRGREQERGEGMCTGASQEKEEVTKCFCTATNRL